MTCYFPPQQVVEEKFMEILHAQAGPVQMAMMYNILADRFGLSRWERRGVRGDPKGSPWQYLVRQARKNLAEKGWVHCPFNGRWALTEAGQAEMRKHEANRPAHA